MRRLSPDDVGLWRRAMHDVAPLRGRPVRPIASPPVVVLAEIRHTVRPEPPLMPAVKAPPPPRLPSLDRNAGVDRATAERVKRGRYQVEARLDLHGMTQEEAHRALSRFVVGSRNAGRRCVLVITGHGRATGGILKSAVPRWLGDPGLRPHLLALSPAQPRDGGTAALYLLLRGLPRD